MRMGRTFLRLAREACQKSWAFCILNQIPDDPWPRASLTLSDISGVKPARQLTMRESVTRETPMCAAKAVTLIGMFSSASFRILPGWGGLNICTAVSVSRGDTRVEEYLLPAAAREDGVDGGGFCCSAVGFRLSAVSHEV